MASGGKVNWIFYNAMGAISVGCVNSFWRLNPWSLSIFWLLIVGILPTTFLTQYGFVKAYLLAPSFIQAWFIGSAFTSIAGFLCSVFIFHEQIKAVNIIGIAFILLGGWLLK
jgi:drug/metabolite transporter (DMT)-like permease